MLRERITHRTFVLFTAIASLLKSADVSGALEGQYPTDCTALLESAPVFKLEPKEEVKKQVHEYISKAMKSILPADFIFAVPGSSLIENPKSIKLTSDHQYPAVLMIESSNSKRRIPHEMLTANDYALHLAKQGLAFVFIGEFENHPVPMFDGLIIDPKTGKTIANVSLKSSQTKRTKLITKILIEELSERFSLDLQFKRYMNGPGWYQALNQVFLNAKEIKRPQTLENIRRAKVTADLFQVPIDKDPKNPQYRELRTVLDMRKSGYNFNDFKNPELLKAVQNIVDQHRDKNLTLTLLWSINQVIDFR